MEIRLDIWNDYYARRVASIRPSIVRMLFAAASRPDIISFAGGMPHPRSFPVKEIAQAMDDVFEEPEVAFQYGPSEGLWELREEISKLMKEREMDVHPEGILITDGAQQGLDLLGKIFINPGDLVVTEGPSYVGALNAFLSYEAQIISIPMDEEGAQPEILEKMLSTLRKERKRPKFIYLIPNYQNPTGLSLSLKRRKEMVEIAEKYQTLLVEDDAYGYLGFSPGSYPTLRKLKEDTVYLNTFSKIFSPGMRIGWLSAPKPLLEKFSKAKEAENLCPSPFTQKVLLAYLKRFDLKGQTRKVAAMYRERCQAMLQALEESFPSEATWTKPEGGLFIWVTLPDYFDTTEMLAKALEEKVAYIPGEAFYADGRGKNSLRLNFSYSEVEVIWEGIKRLNKVVKEQFKIYKAFYKKSSFEKEKTRPQKEKGER